MPVTAVGVGAGISAVGSIFGGKSAEEAASTAAGAQLQAARESIEAQKAGAKKGFDIFSREIERSRQALIQSTRRAGRDLSELRSELIDPNSEFAQRERDAFSRTIGRTLQARGLTGSGTETAGLADFELGLARERRGQNIGLTTQIAGLKTGLGAGLANLASNKGSTAVNLFGNLGREVGSTLSTAATNAANLNMAGANALTQGYIGVGNAAQQGILGFQNLSAQQANQAFQQRLLSSIFGDQNTYQAASNYSRIQ